MSEQQLLERKRLLLEHIKAAGKAYLDKALSNQEFRATVKALQKEMEAVDALLLEKRRQREFEELFQDLQKASHAS